jgi:hypothetical protein
LALRNQKIPKKNIAAAKLPLRKNLMLVSSFPGSSFPRTRE